MRTITTYQCEGCGKRFTERFAAAKHEAECYKIRLDDMRAWASALDTVHTGTRSWDRIADADAYLDRFYEKYKTSRDKMPYYYEPYIHIRYD
jgi:hypothetical protein